MDPRPLGISDNTCEVTECARKVRYWLPSGPLQFSFMEALFGYEEPPYPDLVRVCKECYRAMHRKDGITLGYRRRAGKTQAYVKDVHY